ncbi:MAG: shikimate kinase [Hyphomicrobiaceae bacterium]
MKRPMGESARRIRERLGDRSIVLVGLMGCGKSSIGRRLSSALSLGFVDADDEIERAAGKTIPEIFEDYGEAYFRDGERRVIARLLKHGPQVLATGGGAYMSEETQAAIRERGIAVWLKAELSVLMRRVMRRSNRPLLKAADPEAKMRELMALRYPVYAKADLTVETREVPHDIIVGELIETLARALDADGTGIGAAIADPLDASAGTVPERSGQMPPPSEPSAT